ncbi:MAG: hypothetical protein E7774_07125 [Bradyrhizobium sp.]|nr:MAG: hypothetical protein E7774_07125 [Bradyrhizobium sp.]
MAPTVARSPVKAAPSAVNALKSKEAPRLSARLARPASARSRSPSVRSPARTAVSRTAAASRSVSARIWLRSCVHAPQAARQMTMMRITPSAKADWRATAPNRTNRRLEEPRIDWAAAGADEITRVATGVEPGNVIKAPSETSRLRNLGARNYQFIKAFGEKRGYLFNCRRREVGALLWTEFAMTKRPAAADPETVKPRPPLRRGERLRRRAAWMYYVEEMTQSAIAQALGVGRVSVVRMLAEARAQGEIRIALARGLADLSGLEIALAKALDIPEAIVAPLSNETANADAAIGAALGEFVSEMLVDDMKIGLGWGRTLWRSLGHLSERSVKGVTVVSLVGGVTHVGPLNPGEFAWQFARAYSADCYLIPAPSLVDSAATRQALIERCGLAKVYDFARRLDAVVFGVGALGGDSTLARFDLIDEAERRRLGEYGAVGEALCYIFSAEGRLIDNPINERVMSVPLEAVAAAPIRVLAAGGAEKIAALRGAARLLRPTTIVTDEITARTLTAG